VIRGEIGFDGLLMSDDVSMGALSGRISARTKAALFAGCDIVLHCNGDMNEMQQVAEEAKPLDGPVLRRADHALAQLQEAKAFDRGAAESRLIELMGHA
jgi:beta-N-acetylhexosaminidase